MKLLRHLVCTSIGLLVAAAPCLAVASPPFPEAIRADLGLTYSLGTAACLSDPSAPDCHCTICHETNSGGVNTVVRPFGIAMKANHLMEEDTTSLQTALSTLDRLQIDSDCNHLPDIEQLEQGRDPNTGLYIDGSGRTAPPESGCGGELESFGCGGQIAPVGAPWEGAAAVVAVLGLALVRRRRAR